MKRLITEARRRYEKDLALANDKSFYSYIYRSLKSKVLDFSLKYGATGGIVYNQHLLSEMFAQQLDGVFTNELDGDLPALPANTRNPSSLDTIVFKEEKVQDAIASLKNNASPGIDGIPPSKKT